MFSAAILASVSLILAPGDASSAWQRRAWQDDGLPLRRTVIVPGTDPPPPIVVTEFFGHGAIGAKQQRIAVYCGKRQVPARIMQTGRGDFCRVAFQPNGSQDRQFQVYYGGQPARGGPPPPWQPGPGLILETRSWRKCNLNRLDSVRAAFQASSSLGSDYVSSVFHRCNPMTPTAAPFLSHYEGRLQITAPGKYAFYTSSQDCSFLLIDGEQVVAAPGRHGPARRARHPGYVTLQPGAHELAYWHAAAGPSACMVAAWRPPQAARPRPIPPEAFGADRIARLPARYLEHRTRRLQPDFALVVLGEAPVSDDGPWMVRVRLENTTAKMMMQNARCRWQFGDGQESEQQDPQHVYLHPGPYRVTLTVRRGSRQLQSTSVVVVSRPRLLPGQKTRPAETPAKYLPVLATYDPRQLDSAGLLQLVRVYLDAGRAGDAAQAGQAALASATQPVDDATGWQIANLVGPVLRDQLDKPQEAFELWRVAGQRIKRPAWRVQCAIEAADICLSDLLRRADARPFLEFATPRLTTDEGELASQTYRVWGDWYARGGQAKAAREAYLKAQQRVGTRRSVTEASAWRGAHSRSTESFLRQGQLNRAARELRRWRREFPADKCQGYFSLLQARYWVAKGKLPNAIAVASDLLTVNPESPYADQLLLLVADSETRLQHAARARAACQSLLTDYPGSPLIEEAKRRLRHLQQAGGSGAARE